MKCEHCGKNEVTFVYKSNINGQVEEKHLCAECAEALGYTQKLAARNQSMLQSLFGGNGPFSDPFFTEPFGALLGDAFPRLTGRSGLGWVLDDPFDDFFAEMPALRGMPGRQETAEQQPETPSGAAAETEAQKPSRFARMRERNALKMELKQAIHQENFERAAELRDQLREMERRDQAAQ